MSNRLPWAAVALAAACLVVGFSGSRTCIAGERAGPKPPVVLGSAAGSMLVTTPDGAVDMISVRTVDSNREVVRRRSTDNGATWSQPDVVLKLTSEEFGEPLPLLTRNGELQFFWMVSRRTGGKPGIDYFIDIWNSHSTSGQTQWSSPQRIFEGYVGSINGMTQLASGRIVLPFAYWVGDRPSGPPTGPNVTTTVYSDDEGRTWRQSPAKLTAPCYADYNGSNYGACEPTILQLADGRVWMLIRTQTGRLYESFSPDGAEWSEPKPSRFLSSDSPAWLVRLPDRRIVLLWNNCENTSRINGEGVYTNRDALHAAISDDEGKTWRGYREICRDPLAQRVAAQAGRPRHRLSLRGRDPRRHDPERDRAGTRPPEPPADRSAVARRNQTGRGFLRRARRVVGVHVVRRAGLLVAGPQAGGVPRRPSRPQRRQVSARPPRRRQAAATGPRGISPPADRGVSR